MNNLAHNDTINSYIIIKIKHIILIGTFFFLNTEKIYNIFSVKQLDVLVHVFVVGRPKKVFKKKVGANVHLAPSPPNYALE